MREMCRNMKLKTVLSCINYNKFLLRVITYEEICITLNRNILYFIRFVLIPLVSIPRSLSRSQSDLFLSKLSLHTEKISDY